MTEDYVQKAFNLSQPKGVMAGSATLSERPLLERVRTLEEKVEQLTLLIQSVCQGFSEKVNRIEDSIGIKS